MSDQTAQADSAPPQTDSPPDTGSTGPGVTDQTTPDVDLNGGTQNIDVSDSATANNVGAIYSDTTNTNSGNFIVEGDMISNCGAGGAAAPGSSAPLSQGSLGASATQAGKTAGAAAGIGLMGWLAIISLLLTLYMWWQNRKDKKKETQQRVAEQASTVARDNPQWGPDYGYNQPRWDATVAYQPGTVDYRNQPGVYSPQPDSVTVPTGSGYGYTPQTYIGGTGANGSGQGSNPGASNNVIQSVTSKPWLIGLGLAALGVGAYFLFSGSNEETQSAKDSAERNDAEDESGRLVAHAAD